MMSSLALNTTPTLKSYTPDLEVIVGDGDAENEKKSFMYHGAILANASEYIDTMLSLPMKEQQTRSISFPDIQPEEWLKWTRYVLVPVAAVEFTLFHIDDVDNKNAINVIQFYDKYQFRSGINLIDSKLSGKMERVTSDYRGQAASDYSSYELVIDLMLRICKDEIDLPLSKRLIPKVIASSFFDLKNLLLNLSEANVKLILPYLFKADEKKQLRILEGLVDLVKGISIHGRSLEEMKLISEEDSFVSTLKTKFHDVGHNKDLLSLLELTPDTICVSGGEGNDHVINGEYTIQRRSTGSGIKLGVMDKWYAMNRDNRAFVIQSMDGQGSTWTISSRIGRCCDRTGGSSMFLFIWHKGGNITSLLPPKYGWEVPVVKSATESRFDINFGSILDVNAKKIRITYSIR